MKKNLYFVLILLFTILLGLGGCSSSDDDWIDLNSEEIIGTWSTGTESQKNSSFCTLQQHATQPCGPSGKTDQDHILWVPAHVKIVTDH